MIDNVLVVDDEQLIRDLLKDTIKRHGIDVKTASSAEEAMEMVVKEDFQVIFSDMRMKGKSGLDVLEFDRSKECRMFYLGQCSFSSLGLVLLDTSPRRPFVGPRCSLSFGYVGRLGYSASYQSIRRQIFVDHDLPEYHHHARQFPTPGIWLSRYQSLWSTLLFSRTTPNSSGRSTACWIVETSDSCTLKV